MIKYNFNLKKIKQNIFYTHLHRVIHQGRQHLFLLIMESLNVRFFKFFIFYLKMVLYTLLFFKWVPTLILFIIKEKEWISYSKPSSHVIYSVYIISQSKYSINYSLSKSLALLFYKKKSSNKYRQVYIYIITSNDKFPGR